MKRKLVFLSLVVLLFATYSCEKQEDVVIQPEVKSDQVMEDQISVEVVPVDGTEVEGTTLKSSVIGTKTYSTTGIATGCFYHAYHANIKLEVYNVNGNPGTITLYANGDCAAGGNLVLAPYPLPSYGHKLIISIPSTDFDENYYDELVCRVTAEYGYLVSGTLRASIY